MLRTYKDLIAWQKAFALCREVYTATRSFPSDERFGLTAQSRRSAVSIPSNIAEGYARGMTGDYLRFRGIAAGSLAELETQLLLAKELGFASPDSLDSVLMLTAEADRILSALIRALSEKGAKQ